MQKKKFTDLLPYIRHALPGADQNLILQEMRQAARELCWRSKRWVYQFDPITIRADRVFYDIISPPETEIAIVTHVSQDGTLLTLTEWRMNSAMDTLELLSTPGADSTKGLEVKAALQPEIDADGMDERVMTDSLDYIVAGTMARLLAMTDKTYSDPSGAFLNKQKFLQGIGRLREVVDREFSPRTLSVAKGFWA